MSLSSTIAAILNRHIEPPKIVAHYQEWVKRALPKEQFVYYKGLCPSQTFVGQVIKDKVYHDYQLGLVHLVTKRMGDHNFDYIAIKSSKRLEN